MRPVTPTLTEQELEIMKIVWDLDSATVRQVYEKLLERRKIAYTTVMTMMKILEEKGHLKRKLDDRAYVYQPTRARQKVVGAMVRDFLDRVFNGSAERLLLHLVEDEQISQAELDEITEAIRRDKAPARNSKRGKS
jgi:predicted transcriptional regulator